MGRWERQFRRQHGMLTKAQLEERKRILAHLHKMAEEENSKPGIVRAWRHLVRTGLRWMRRWSQ